LDRDTIVRAKPLAQTFEACMFRGSIPALVTPMRNGSVDEEAFRAFVDWQIREGSSGVVPVGTTGESPTLSHEEHHRVVEICVEAANGRVPVIAGAGSNNTKEAIELAVHAEKAGANAVLIVTPYYNKPSQRGLYAHFRAIAEAISIPLIIYNIPPRSVVDMSVETMAQLFKDCKNIVGVKDATANLARVSLQRHAMGPEFVQLSGEDPTALGFMAHGGHGCISVTANVAPKLCAEFQEACLAGDFRTALVYQDRLMPLHRALFLEPSPAPTKYALALLGHMAEDVRSPIVAVGAETRGEVESAMRHAGLLN
jgi:4-hydroxy-tetrahydrodipicolinate synthase